MQLGVVGSKLKRLSIYVCVCICVCVRARACVRACVWDKDKTNCKRILHRIYASQINEHKHKINNKIYKIILLLALINNYY